MSGDVRAGMIQCEGLAALDRALAILDTEIQLEMRAGLRAASEPVKVRAGRLAVTKIRNMRKSPEWAKMRLGQTAYQVYLAPARRNRGGSPRPNLAGLLMTRAMRPGLAQTSPLIAGELDAAINTAVKKAGF